jgi:hypothetical protein
LEQRGCAPRCGIRGTAAKSIREPRSSSLTGRSDRLTRTILQAQETTRAWSADRRGSKHRAPSCNLPESPLRLIKPHRIDRPHQLNRLVNLRVGAIFCFWCCLWRSGERGRSRRSVACTGAERGRALRGQREPSEIAIRAMLEVRAGHIHLIHHMRCVFIHRGAGSQVHIGGAPAMHRL